MVATALTTGRLCILATAASGFLRCPFRFLSRAQSGVQWQVLPGGVPIPAPVPLMLPGAGQQLGSSGMSGQPVMLPGGSVVYSSGGMQPQIVSGQSVYHSTGSGIPPLHTSLGGYSQSGGGMLQQPVHSGEILGYGGGLLPNQVRRSSSMSSWVMWGEAVCASGRVDAESRHLTCSISLCRFACCPDR